MGMTLDTSKAEKKLADIDKLITLGARIASREEAENLRRELEVDVPFLTGRLSRSFETREGAKRGWWVAIPRSAFPGFFYAILFIPLYREIVRRVKPAAQSRMTIRFTNILNARLRD